MSHDHHPDHHHHHHHHHPLDFEHVSRLFIVGIALNIIFVAVEFGAGFFSNSLALISDAGHHLSDVSFVIGRIQIDDAEGNAEIHVWLPQGINYGGVV